MAQEIPHSESLQTRVLSHGCPKTAYLFASTVPNADVKALYAFANSKNMAGLDETEIEHFMRLSESAGQVQKATAPPPEVPVGHTFFAADPDDHRAAEQEVLSQGNSTDAFLFAASVEGSNVRALYMRAHSLKFEGLTEEQRYEFRAIAEQYLKRQKELAALKQTQTA